MTESPTTGGPSLTYRAVPPASPLHAGVRQLLEDEANRLRRRIADGVRLVLRGELSESEAAARTAPLAHRLDEVLDTLTGGALLGLVDEPSGEVADDQTPPTPLVVLPESVVKALRAHEEDLLDHLAEATAKVDRYRELATQAQAAADVLTSELADVRTVLGGAR